MSQSLANIVVHLVFSTKGRRQLLRDEERGQLHAYITGILKSHDSPLIEINSVRDHIHILFAQSKNHAPAKIVEQVKTASSGWIKTLDPWYADFAWQGGYGEFSVSPIHVESVRQYIRGQADLTNARIFKPNTEGSARKTANPWMTVMCGIDRNRVGRGPKARHVTARPEGPGEWQPYDHLEPCKGVPIHAAAKPRTARVVRRVSWVALSGLDIVGGTMNPGLQPGLSHCGLSARRHANAQFEKYDAERHRIEAAQPTSDFDKAVEEAKGLEAAAKPKIRKQRRKQR